MDIRAERKAVGMTQARLAREAHVSQPNLSAYENGRRQPSQGVRDRIRAALTPSPPERLERHREDIRRLVAEHHATDPRVFGSIARDEDHGASDVDLLVDFTDDASLFDEVALRLALVDLLRMDVDVVAADALRGAARERILLEAVPI